MKKLLFARHYPSPCFSGFLLSMRLLFGILLLMHGFDKLTDFSAYAANFPNPLGIGSELSLALVVFAEFFCSLAFIAGFLFRLAVLPMIFSMGVAFFVTHDSSLAQGELAFIYLAVFVMLATTGPGIYSADHLISKLCWTGKDAVACNTECC
ncbi:MAG: DoxX family protein [Bacteroidaceae bacterium]|nr:DoxX family protein [Bacteroidaceae bacterium]